MEIVVSICSRQKSKDKAPLPAAQRYTGSHIKLVEAVARERGAPFWILSGKLGLVEAQEIVEEYDYLLTDDAVDGLAQEIGAGLAYGGVRRILFYTKDKPAWRPYLKALRQAAARCQTELVVEYLPDDA